MLPGQQIRIKRCAGKMYATYLIENVFCNSIDPDKAYLEQERMHWLHNHAGKSGIVTNDKTGPGYVCVEVKGSHGVVPLDCLVKIA